MAVRWTARGTHDGDLNGIPATGESVAVSGCSFDRMGDGRIVETHSTQDMLGPFRQIDAAPTGAA